MKFTRTKCKFQRGGGGEFNSRTPPAYTHVILYSFSYIAGPPSAPVTSLRDMSNGTVLRLSWVDPHISDRYPVTSYTVLVFNHTSSTLLVNTTLNSSLHFYDFIKPKYVIVCENISFAVSAHSAAGSGPVSHEMGMFPRSEFSHINTLLHKHMSYYMNNK